MEVTIDDGESSSSSSSAAVPANSQVDISHTLIQSTTGALPEGDLISNYLAFVDLLKMDGREQKKGDEASAGGDGSSSSDDTPIHESLLAVINAASSDDTTTATTSTSSTPKPSLKGYALSDPEIIQIINLLPTDKPLLGLIIQELEQRFTDVESQGIMDVCKALRVGVDDDE
jgi:hypothetical protein